MQLQFQSYGSGKPLIILHGLFGSHDNWQTLSRRFAERFQVFALDQRNHGGSPHSPEMNYQVMAEDLIHFMATHHLARAHVLGHSMGGKTAMQAALLHPDKIDKLVVVDIAPRAYSPRHGQIFEGALSLDPAAFQTRAEMEAALAPSIPEKTVRQFLLKNVTRDPNGAFRWKMNLKDIFKNYDRLSEALPADDSFEGPTLFIRGELSRYIREPDLELIRRTFPHFQMQTIKNAGHWVHSEQPQAFHDAVMDFLSAK